ncbi:MAG TPA: formyltransferase family protein [Candidatus Deferrimicrobium sp.]|nr:formyltransferase family protein [Candidatus Deferrimicrobium sp.]
MIVLMLGPARPHLIEYLKSFGDEVRTTEEKLTGESAILDDVDFIVSYGYRHILKRDVLDRFADRAINLHISLLPFNRGANPNLWSFLEDTPKGVTIHRIDEGVDTGDILAQQDVVISATATLKTSYDQLATAIEVLFQRVWPEIRSLRRDAVPQPEGGTMHRRSDRAHVEHLLHSGWDTPVAELTGKALTKTLEGRR